MPKEHSYKFCFGPWNLSEGSDPYGPTTRPEQTFDWKLNQLKKRGFDAMMFHDDDAVPDVDQKSGQQILKEAKELKKRLANEGVAAEMVAPRLWFGPMSFNGVYTSNNSRYRQRAIDRSLRSIDIANALGTNLIVLSLAREGPYLRKFKEDCRGIELLVGALDAMLAHDKNVRLAIEPKPKEPMDRTSTPMVRRTLTIATLTSDPNRVGCAVVITHNVSPIAHPSDEIELAMTFDKIWSVHWDSANELEIAQNHLPEKRNLRSVLDQVSVLERNGYGQKGECVCFGPDLSLNAKAMQSLENLQSQRRKFLVLVEKIRGESVGKQSKSLVRSPYIFEDESDARRRSSCHPIRLRKNRIESDPQRCGRKAHKKSYHPLQALEVPGRIAETIGTGRNAQSAIAWGVIKGCFGCGLVLTLAFEATSMFLGKGVEVDAISRIWSIFSPILTGVVGYAFGVARKLS